MMENFYFTTEVEQIVDGNVWNSSTLLEVEADTMFDAIELVEGVFDSWNESYTEEQLNELEIFDTKISDIWPNKLVFDSNWIFGSEFEL